ncbi:MAG TPA: caspase family protein [Rectinemataceae bacterium]
MKKQCICLILFIAFCLGCTTGPIPYSAYDSSFERLTANPDIYVDFESTRIPSEYRKAETLTLLEQSIKNDIQNNLFTGTGKGLKVRVTVESITVKTQMMYGQVIAYSGLGLFLLGNIDNYQSTFSLVDAIIGSLATTISVFLPRSRASIESNVAIELSDLAGNKKRFVGSGQSEGITYWIGGDNISIKYGESLKKAVDQAKNRIRADKESLAVWMRGSDYQIPSFEVTTKNTAFKKKVALVIGNMNYQTTATLRTPMNDAMDISARLTDLGFSVSKVIDGNKEQIENAIIDFGRNLNGADVGLFYYAGHGVQYNNENYLIPVDSSYSQAFELKYRAIPVGFLLDYMRYANCDLNIIVLDACRDNPLLGSRSTGERGLAVEPNLPKSSIPVYSTAPGNTASDGYNSRNSPFAASFIRNILIPKLEIRKVFDNIGSEVTRVTSGSQRPWFSTDYYGTFYFSE